MYRPLMVILLYNQFILQWICGAKDFSLDPSQPVQKDLTMKIEANV